MAVEIRSLGTNWVERLEALRARLVAAEAERDQLLARLAAVRAALDAKQ